MKKTLKKFLAYFMSVAFFINGIYVPTTAAGNDTQNGETENAFAKYTWVHDVFGPNAVYMKKNDVVNGYETQDGSGSVRLFSVGTPSSDPTKKAGSGSGKLTKGAKDADGINVYYTAVPADKNFTFRAKAKVNTWYYTNGQEGFGILAMDRDTGRYADQNIQFTQTSNTYYYNNVIYAMGTGNLEYLYDNGEIVATTDGSDSVQRITLSDGLITRSKLGLTKEVLALIDEEAAKEESSRDVNVITALATENMTAWQEPLTLLGAENGTGIYNLIGNCDDTNSTKLADASRSVGSTVEGALTEFDLEISRSDEGYCVTYYAADGSVVRQVKTEDRDALSKLDEDYIYVGLMTSRCADATFSDVTLTIESDEDGNENELAYYQLSGEFLSPATTDAAAYNLRFKTNWNANVKMTMGEKVIYDGACTAGEELTVSGISLGFGANKIDAVVTPDETYHPEDKETNVLENYDPVNFSFTVDRSGSENAYYQLNGEFLSPATTDAAAYDLRFKTNWNANVKMTLGAKVIYDGACTAGEELTVSGISLGFGANKINAAVTPDETYHPEDKETNVLENYDPVNFSFTVDRPDPENAFVKYTWKHDVWGANAGYSETVRGEDDQPVKVIVNGYEKLDSNHIRLYSDGNYGRGKLVNSAQGTDGINVYYTAVDSTKNFTFRVKAHVNNWFYKRGQEGFGILALDRDSGAFRDESATYSRADESFYNNVYYAIACSRISYYYENGEITNSVTAPKIQLNEGLAACSKTGLTKENLPIIEETNSKASDYVTYFQEPLTLKGAELGAGNYNLIGNNDTAKNEDGVGTPVEELLTDFDLEIQRNNTGYFITYYAPDGSVVRQVKTYDRDALSQLDENYIYVGLVTSRCGDVTFSDAVLTITDPEQDGGKEEKELTYYELNGGFQSSAVANTEKYDLRFKVNWDAKVTMTLGDKVIYDGDCDADEILTVSDLSLDYGGNVINAVITPSADYHPENEETNVLKSYDAVGIQFIVNRVAYGKEGCYLFVAPNGTEEGLGTREKPLDIYTAVKYVQKGQAIVLKPGTYALESELVAESGVNGTKDEPIYMMPDTSDSTGRVVLNFTNEGGAFSIRGDHWIVRDIDITGHGGLVINGSYNTVEGVSCYGMANEYGFKMMLPGKVTKDSGLWPHDNLILNCSAHDNSRGIYIRCVAENNVVDGFVASYNKERGIQAIVNQGDEPSESVTFRNCVSYFNGYIHDAEGKVVSYAQGDGFSIGGGSLKTDHVLINCYSFYNTGGGFVSNSGRAINMTNCVAYNNKRRNINLDSSLSVEETAKENPGELFDYKTQNVISLVVPGNFPECLGMEDGIAEDAVGNDWISEYGRSGLKNESTFLMYYDQEKNEVGSWNSTGQEFAAAYFKSTDFTADTITRNADGTINMGDFLALADGVKETLSGLADADLSLKGSASSNSSELLSQLQETAGEKFGEEVKTAMANGKIMSIFTRADGADIIQIVNEARSTAKGTKKEPEIVAVPQAYDDTTYVEESYVKGKVKTRIVQMNEPGGTCEITLNTGVNYTLEDFNSKAYKSMKITTNQKKSTVKVTKKGVMTIKANKLDGYEATIEYTSLADPTKTNTLIVKAENLKAQKAGTITGGEGEFEVHLSTTGTQQKADLLSTKWSIAKTELKPGEWTEVYKGKKTIAKAYLAPDNSYVTIAGDEESQLKKGNIKVVAEINGKKINTTVKFKK